MKGSARKALIISTLVAFTIIGYQSLLTAVTSGASAAFIERTRYKIFYLLDFELKDGSPIGQNPGSNTRIYIIDSESNGNTIKGQAVVTILNEITSYTVSLRATMAQDPAQGKKYIVWLQSRTGLESIQIGEQTGGIIQVDNYQSNRDLSSYLVTVSEEDAQPQTPPSQPSTTPIIQSGQALQVSQPTSVPQPTSAQPQPTSPQGQPTTAPGDPQPTQPGNPGQEDINQKVQSAINAVQASNIQTYLEALTDAEPAPENDSQQSRYTGTSGNEQEAQYIKAHFDSLSLDTEYQSFTSRGTPSKNIIARMYGEDRNNWYLVMAHMDSTAASTQGWRPGERAPGADDNGSGTATVMEIARALASSGISLNKSVEFILFSGEEQGLNGSEHYASNIPAGKNIIGIINVDMIGNKGPTADCVNFLYQEGNGGNIFADEIVNVNNDFNIGLTVKAQTNSDFISRSDQWPFIRRGILGTFGFECTMSPVYHEVNDTTDYISYSQLEKTAKAVAGTVVKISHTALGQSLAPRLSNSDEPEVVLGEHTVDAPLLVKVNYNELSEMEYVYKTSEGPIGNWQGDDIDQPFFLGLFTEPSLDILVQAGYQTQIIDENADLETYWMYWHPEPNQGDLLRDEGIVTQMSPHIFLVKYSSVEERNALHTGPVAKFFENALVADTKAPRFNTPRITPVPTISADSAASESSQQLSTIVLAVIGLIAMLAGGFGFYMYWRSRKEE